VRSQSKASARPGSAVPEHPRAEDAVEQRLDDGGAEEALAAIAPEGDAEGRFDGRSEVGQLVEGGVAEAQLGVLGVGGQQARHVGRVGQRGAVGEHALQKRLEPLRPVSGHRVGGLRKGPERVGGVRQRKALQHRGRVVGAVGQEPEGAEVGDEDRAVAVEVARHLLALLQGVERPVDRFRLNGAAGWGRRVAFLVEERGPRLRNLIVGKEAAVRQPGAGVRQIHHALHRRILRRPDRGEEVFEGRIVRQFVRARQRPNGANLLQVVGKKGHGPGSRSTWHQNMNAPAATGNTPNAQAAKRSTLATGHFGH